MEYLLAFLMKGEDIYEHNCEIKIKIQKLENSKKLEKVG